MGQLTGNHVIRGIQLVRPGHCQQQCPALVRVAGSAVPPVLHPSLLVLQLLHKDAERDGIQILARTQKSYIQRLPSVASGGDLIVEGYQVSQDFLNLCRLCLMIALPVKCLTVVPNYLVKLFTRFS